MLWSMPPRDPVAGRVGAVALPTEGGPPAAAPPVTAWSL